MNHSTSAPNDQTPDGEYVGNDPSVLAFYRLVERKMRESAGRYTQDSNTAQDCPLISHATGMEPHYLKGPARRSTSKWLGLFANTARSVRETLVKHAENGKTRDQESEFNGRELDEIIAAMERENRIDVISLERALSRLDQTSPSTRVLIELRLFGGLSVERTAELLGASPTRIELDWRLASARLYRELKHPSRATVISFQQMIDESFIASLAIAADQRSDFLHLHCGDDSDLHDEVDLLLAVDTQLRSSQQTFLRASNWIQGACCEALFETIQRIGIENLSELSSVSTIVQPFDAHSTIALSPTIEPSSEDAHDATRSLQISSQDDDGEFGQSFPVIPGFEIMEEVGRGGMGVVYRAMDLSHQQIVALKTMIHADSGMLARFKKEFRSLAGVMHPNLAKLYELATDKGVPYLTMEYVPGRDFRSYVRDGWRSGQPMSQRQQQRLRAAVVQLAEGVAALHAAGKVHRDIKPSNVLVTSSGRVVIVDFGLAIELSSDGTYQSIHRRISGTPKYMSPEQAIGEPVTPASDWYSVGVVLYQTLSGRTPFSGKMAELRKQRRTPPSLDAPNLPSDIAQLCIDLLHPDPARRPCGEDVLSRVGKAASKELPTKTKSSFVGREEQLQRLRSGYRMLRQRRPMSILLCGMSGSGKSALIAEFLKEIAGDPDVLVLSGRCYKQETVPYKAVDELVDALSRFLCSLSNEQADAYLPRDTFALARVFPVLAQVDAVRRAPSREFPHSDQQEFRQRAFVALRELLTRLGDRTRLVLVIDDLQWGDADSAALLNLVLRQPDGPAALFVGSFRSEDLESSESLGSLVAGLQPVEQVSLDSLTERESLQFAKILLAEGVSVHERDDFACQIAAESRGNPFFLRELARGVVNRSTERSIENGLTLEELLWTRVEELPPQMRSLLYTLSVAGQPLQKEYVSVASTLDASNILQTFKTLRDEHLIRDCGNEEDTLIDTYHDRVREIVCARINAETKKECHKRLAEVGETLPQSDVKFLALHFRMAGEEEKAGRYYMYAGDEAYEKLAFNQAANFYADALRLHQFVPSMRLRLRTKRADALSSDCRNVEAAKEYLELSEYDGANRLDLLRRAFTQYLCTGRIKDGMEILPSALEQIGLSFPKSSRGALLKLVVARLWLWRRGLGIDVKDPENIPSSDLLRVDMLHSVAMCLTTGDHIRGAAFVSASCNEALRVGDPSRIARALAMESGHLASQGKFLSVRAAKMIKLAKSVLENVDDPLVANQVLLCEGIGAGVLGNWDSCYLKCKNAERGFLSNEVGEITTARFWTMMAIIWLGKLRELQHHCPNLVRTAEARGDLYELVNLGTFPLSMARLAQDAPRVAWEEVNSVLENWTPEGFHIQHHLGVISRASIFLYEGKTIEAESELKQYWSLHKRSLLWVVHAVRANLLHLRARVALHSIGSQSPYANPQRVARKAIRALEREKLPWTTALATAGRGSLAAKLGKTELAKQYLSKAATNFAAIGMELYAVASTRHLGQLERGPVGRSKIEAADKWMTENQMIVAPERMAAFLVPGSDSPGIQA